MKDIKRGDCWKRPHDDATGSMLYYVALFLYKNNNSVRIERFGTKTGDILTNSLPKKFILSRPDLVAITREEYDAAKTIYGV